MTATSTAARWQNREAGAVVHLRRYTGAAPDHDGEPFPSGYVE